VQGLGQVYLQTMGVKISDLKIKHNLAGLQFFFASS